MKQEDLLKMLIPIGVPISRVPSDLASQMERYGVIETEDCKRFLANCLHESGLFTRFEENAYYTTAERLRMVFPSAFKSRYNANDYLRNPEKLLNLVYDDRIFRKGLGNTQDGDGYKYRGRGAIQVTGRANYLSLSRRSGIDFISNPDLLSKEYRFISALDFWKNNKLSSKKSLLETRQVISGNYTQNPFGYAGVKTLYDKMK